ncbi:winged helix-turn-helix domain-containing protein [Nonomuraea ferruginea]
MTRLSGPDSSGVALPVWPDGVTPSLLEEHQVPPMPVERAGETRRVLAAVLKCCWADQSADPWPGELAPLERVLDTYRALIGRTDDLMRNWAIGALRRLHDSAWVVVAERHRLARPAVRAVACGVPRGAERPGAPHPRAGAPRRAGGPRRGPGRRRPPGARRSRPGRGEPGGAGRGRVRRPAERLRRASQGRAGVRLHGGGARRRARAGGEVRRAARPGAAAHPHRDARPPRAHARPAARALDLGLRRRARTRRAAGRGPGESERAVLTLVLVHSVAIPRAEGLLPEDSWLSPHPAPVDELRRHTQLPIGELESALRALRHAGLVTQVKAGEEAGGYVPGPQFHRLTPEARRRLQEELILAAGPDTPLAVAVRARRAAR